METHDWLVVSFLFMCKHAIILPAFNTIYHDQIISVYVHVTKLYFIRMSVMQNFTGLGMRSLKPHFVK